MCHRGDIVPADRGPAGAPPHCCEYVSRYANADLGVDWRRGDDPPSPWRTVETFVERLATGGVDVGDNCGRSWDDYTGNAIEYFTWLSAKLNSIEAMPSSRVSLFFRNASYDDRSAATTRNR